MSKLKLVASPTFTATVPIPLAGGEPAPVVMTFKHRTRAQCEAWLKEKSEAKADTDFVLEMVVGWDLEEPLTKENVELLLQNYMGAAKAITDVYLEQLYQAKLGNSGR
jgi:hypothetical protein